MATVTVLRDATGGTYTINASLQNGVIAGSGSGADQYYIDVNTSQKDAEGHVIPDQILTSFNPSDDFTVAVTTALETIMGLTSGSTLSSSSSSSSVSSASSASSNSSSSSSSTA